MNHQNSTPMVKPHLDGTHGQILEVHHRTQLLTAGWQILKSDCRNGVTVDHIIISVFLSRLHERGWFTFDTIRLETAETGGLSFAVEDEQLTEKLRRLLEVESADPAAIELLVSNWAAVMRYAQLIRGMSSEAHFRNTRIQVVKKVIEQAARECFQEHSLWVPQVVLREATKSTGNKKTFALVHHKNGHTPQPTKQHDVKRNDAVTSFGKYLDTYLEKREKKLDFSSGRAEISGDRAYRILIHIIQDETVSQFLALDLSFDRWAELVTSRPDGDSSLAKQIFGNIKGLLKRGCEFRRILVVTPKQLRGEIACKVLTYIRDREQDWRSEHLTGTAETRILLQEDVNERTRPEIDPLLAEVQDFVLFLQEGNDLGLIEVGLTSARDTKLISDSKFELTRQVGDIRLRKERFKQLWSEYTESLDQVIARITSNQSSSTTLPRPSARS